MKKTLTNTCISFSLSYVHPCLALAPHRLRVHGKSVKARTRTVSSRFNFRSRISPNTLGKSVQPALVVHDVRVKGSCVSPGCRLVSRTKIKSSWQEYRELHSHGLISCNSRSTISPNALGEVYSRH